MQAGSTEVPLGARLGAFCVLRKLRRGIALTVAQQVLARDANIDNARGTNASVRDPIRSVEISADRLERAAYTARIFGVIDPVVIVEAFERPKNSRFVRHWCSPLRE